MKVSKCSELNKAVEAGEVQTKTNSSCLFAPSPFPFWELVAHQSPAIIIVASAALGAPPSGPWATSPKGSCRAEHPECPSGSPPDAANHFLTAWPSSSALLHSFEPDLPSLLSFEGGVQL